MRGRTSRPRDQTLELEPAAALAGPLRVTRDARPAALPRAARPGHAKSLPASVVAIPAQGLPDRARPKSSMQGASTSIKHACHSSLSLSKSHEPCPCSKEKQGSLSAQRRTQLDSASPVHGAECAGTRRASSTQQRASKSRQARSTATLQPTTQFRPLKIVLGKRNGTKHVCTQEPRHRLIVQPGGALHEVLL